MLTGQNGILTNAQNANMQSDYFQAEERVRLAYMAVKTEIMTQKATNSSYNAQSNAGRLGKIVADELKGSEWTVTPDGTDLTATGTTINIRYSKSSLKEGGISTTPKRPKQNSYVDYVITLKEQDAELTIDGENVTTSASNPSNPGTQPTSNKPLVTELRVGNEVVYTDGNQNEIPCIVLYDSTGNYGIQIVTKDTTDSQIELGGDDFSAAKRSYNTAVASLNNAALGYLNTDFSPVNGARCIGSDPSALPITSEEDTGTFIIDDDYLASVGISAPYDDYYESYEYFTPYNNMLKRGNGFSNNDYNQMESIGIEDVQSLNYYWLASRYLGEGTMQIAFQLLAVKDGYMGRKEFLSVNDPSEWGDETTTAFGTASYYLRPVFTIKPTIHYEERNNQKYLVLE